MEASVIVKNLRDYRDHVVMTLVSCAWVAATVYLFMFHSDVNFATWCGFSATICGVYHWLTIRDDKQPDACNHDPNPT